jgi:hypothetical protein
MQVTDNNYKEKQGGKTETEKYHQPREIFHL